MEVSNQMKNLGEKVTEKMLVDKMFVSLTKKIDAIEESKDFGSLTLSELTGSLEANESRHANKKDEEVEGAFQAKH